MVNNDGATDMAAHPNENRARSAARVGAESFLLHEVLLPSFVRRQGALSTPRFASPAAALDKQKTF